MARQFPLAFPAVTCLAACFAAAGFPASGQVFFDGVDQGPSVILSDHSGGDVVVESGGTLEIFPGGEALSLQQRGGHVTLDGGTIFATLELVVAPGGTRVTGGVFEMNSGLMAGLDVSGSEGDFLAHGLEAAGGRVGISGGTLRGSGVLAPCCAPFAGSGLVASGSVDLVIDGGEFRGGTNTLEQGLVVSGAGAIVGGYSSGAATRAQIHGGMFVSGDVTAAESGFVEAGLVVQGFGSVVEVWGGTFRAGYHVNSEAVAPSLNARNNSTVNIHGGDFEVVGLNVYFQGENTTTLNLFAKSFFLDEAPIDFAGQSIFKLDADSGELTVDFLGQGLETFDILNPYNGSLNLIQVSGLMGDYNNDGFVSQADLDLVLLNWGDDVTPDGWVEATPFDGLMSQNELDAVLLNWGAGDPPAPGVVPEPAAVGLLAGAGWLGRRRRAA